LKVNDSISCRNSENWFGKITANGRQYMPGVPFAIMEDFMFLDYVESFNNNNSSMQEAFDLSDKSATSEFCGL
jgi:hypothetical protein